MAGEEVIDEANAGPSGRLMHGQLEQMHELEVEDGTSIASSEEGRVNNFAGLANGVLRSVENTEPLILDLQHSHPPSPSFSGAIRDLETHDHDKVAKESVEILQSITEHAHAAHLYLCIQKNNDRSLKEAKLRDPLEHIGRELDKLLQSLLSSLSSSDKWKALEIFNRFARKSMNGSTKVSLSSLALSWDSESTMLDYMSPPPGPAKPPDTIGIQEGICPLERAMLNYSIISQSGDHKYHLEDFVEWARSEYPSSIVHSKIGAIRTVYMFRELGRFHHEYVLIAFGDGEVEESWLRAERAADVHKPSGRAKKAHLIDPIVRGAVLRQTITFSRSMGGLIEKEDTNYVSVVVNTSLPSSSPKQIHLNELGTQFVQVSTTSDLYFLFTENCRWFARRNILSIIERLSEAKVGFYTAWHGKRCPDKKIRDNLRKGPFSGWQLSGPKSTLIEAKGLLDHSWTLLSGKQYAEVVDSCRKAHTLLSSVKVPSPRRDNLCSTALSLLAQGLDGLGKERWQEGLDAHQEACKISSKLRVEFEDHFFNTHNSFAIALHRIGRFQDAIDIWNRLLSAHRTIHAEKQTIVSTDSLAIFLFNYSLALDRVRGHESSRLEYMEEAITLRRDLYKQRHDIYSKTYGAVLDEYAHLLDISNRSTEALKASEKAVAIMRAEYEHHPDSRNELARCLYNHARYAARLKEWRKARMAGMESVEHWRFLFLKDGGEYDVDLAKALEKLGQYHSETGRPKDGFDCLLEALGHRRARYVADVKQYAKPLAKLLARMADELDNAKESGNALPQSEIWKPNDLRRQASKVTKDGKKGGKGRG